MLKPHFIISMLTCSTGKCRSTFHSGALTPLMEFFCQQLVHSAAASAAQGGHPPFERFLIRGILFLSATLRSSTFHGSAPVHFRLSEAAQEQVTFAVTQ